VIAAAAARRRPARALAQDRVLFPGVMGTDRRRRPADSVNRSFEKALNRRAPWIGWQVLLNAVCACAAYAVADCLVSSSFKTLDVAHLRIAGCRRSGGEVNLETPGGKPEIVARRCGRSI